jgi:hypothetical protein
LAGRSGDVGCRLALAGPENGSTANLAKVMENMAGVEIGPLNVDRDLVLAAIARAQELTENAARDAAPRP